ncbi:hypothetical protein O181_015626 [Austropuccinia psidii MF-1]|uniref:Uncharacterized protein n=1 Tax=Austropuccinia psidii MF-1 TaxID=1389203 RepID=A0A9Q3C440_9BASI|nr:hypothetical protein [Austropuccinia psidii MF-1]
MFKRSACPSAARWRSWQRAGPIWFIHCDPEVVRSKLTFAITNSVSPCLAPLGGLSLQNTRVLRLRKSPNATSSHGIFSMPWLPR